MKITPAIKQAAQAKAAQLLSTELKDYTYVCNNSAALTELWKRIELEAKKCGKLYYTDWPKGVEFVRPNGEVYTVKGNYKLAPVEAAINEFLRYLVLKSCAEYGFMVTTCIVNKSGDNKDKPSETYFALAKELGLLPEEEDLSEDEIEANRSELLTQQERDAFTHQWAVAPQWP